MKPSNIKKQQTMNKQRTGMLFLSICAAFCFFSTLQVAAQGNLMVLPKRVLFEGNKKFQEISLSNIGEDTALYAISIVNMTVNDSGKHEFVADTVSDSSQHYADKFLRIYPRQVRLWKNKTQTVKLQLVHSAQLKPGEYRSHLYFRAIPKPTPLGEKEKIKTDSVTGVSIAPIIPVFGITIPVVIRSGARPEIKVSIQEAKIIKDGGNNVLAVTFLREGNISAYGELTVTHISASGVETQVGYAKGISMYTMNQKRNLLVDLNPDGVNYKEGKLHLVLRNMDKAKLDIMTETDLLLKK